MDDLISRQAAINAILSRTNCKSVRDLYEYTQEHDLSNMWTGGISDAIDMLISVPPANTDLSAYSDRLWKAAYERAYERVCERGKAEAQFEIIRCSDCKHWIYHDKRCGYWNHGVKPLEWCCHAERRADAETEV